MTIKYNYKCDNCSFNYIEQRGNDEPNQFFIQCQSCYAGNYIEISSEIIAEAPEREAAPTLELDSE